MGEPTIWRDKTNAQKALAATDSADGFIYALLAVVDQLAEVTDRLERIDDALRNTIGGRS